MLTNINEQTDCNLIDNWTTRSGPTLLRLSGNSRQIVCLFLTVNDLFWAVRRPRDGNPATSAVGRHYSFLQAELVFRLIKSYIFCVIVGCISSFPAICTCRHQLSNWQMCATAENMMAWYIEQKDWKQGYHLVTWMTYCHPCYRSL